MYVKENRRGMAEKDSPVGVLTIFKQGLKPDEYIDLFSNRQTLEKKQQIAAEFGKRPITACQYCNGFDVERSSRFPAGEQLS